MKTQTIIDHISREFINLKKSDWLALASACIDATHLELDNLSLRKAKLALQFESEWQKEKEERGNVKYVAHAEENGLQFESPEFESRVSAEKWVTEHMSYGIQKCRTGSYEIVKVVK